MPRQMNDGQAYPSSLVLYLSLGFTEAPAVHPTTIVSTLTVTLPVESTYTMNVLQNDCLVLLDRQSHNPPRCGVEEMTSPSCSTHSILRGYDPSNPHIVPFERCNYTHRSTDYTHCLREIVV